MSLKFPFLDHHGIESTAIESEVAVLEALGMRLLRWGNHAGTGQRIALLSDQSASKIELIEVAEATGIHNHIAFAVDDLTLAHAEAVNANCQEEQAPFRLDPARADTSFIRTAPGVLVQLIQYDDDSPDRAPWA